MKTEFNEDGTETITFDSDNDAEKFEKLLKQERSNRIIEVDGDRFTIYQFLALNHFDRDENDRLSEPDLKDLFSLEPGESMFIHLSLIERIS